MYIMHHNLFLGRFLRNHVGFNLTLLQNISTEHDKIKRLAEEIINQKQPPVKHTKTNVDQDIAKEIATKIINIYGNVSEVPDNVTNSGVANRQKGVYTEEKALLKHIFDSYNSIASDSKSTDSDKPNTDKKDDSDEVNEMPEAPTSCCMSGCPNCVWLDYAEKLSRYFRDGGENAIKEINKRITDENIKAFVLHELRMRKLKKY